MRARAPYRSLTLVLLTAARVSAQPAIVLENPDPSTFSQFGASVAARGNDVLVGANDKALLYDGTTWSLLRSFVSPVVGPGGAVSGTHTMTAVGDDVLIGVPWDSRAGTEAGAAYLFDGDTGALLLTLTEPTPGDYNGFGHAVAAFGDDLLVAAPSAEMGGILRGAVYLFDGATGALVRTFVDPTPDDYGEFGHDIAVAGANVAISTPGDMFNGSEVSRDGAVFVLDVATGAQQYRLVDPLAPDSYGDGFGVAVGALGDDVLVGRSPRYGGSPERAFRYDGTTGALEQIFAPGSSSPQGFGAGVAGVGVNVVVGKSFSFDQGVFGPASEIFDGTSGASLRGLRHPTYEETAIGAAVAAVGPNVLIGAPNAYGGIGAAFLYCGGAVPCAPCETCSAAGPCTVGPAATCRAAAPRQNPSSRMQLKIRRPPSPGADTVTWKGPALGSGLTEVPAGDYGRLSRHQLCVFDESGVSPSLAFRAVASTCDTPACKLSSSRKVRRYSDRDRAPDGLSRMVMRSVGDETQIRVNGAGPNLSGRPFGLPTLPLTLPATVQLEERDGRCWSSHYSAAGVILNTDRLFDGRPD